MSDSTDAKHIAIDALRRCYQASGIIAGPHHFTDYWARDGFFAALGSLTIGDDEIVRKMIRLFFTHQRSDGLIPYRIMRGPISLSKYLGKPKLYKKPQPTYRLRGVGQEVIDGTLLCLLFTAILKEKEYLPQVKSALNYLQTREKNGLLWDGVMGEWNDCVLKRGHLLYSNLIYWQTLKQLSQWQKSHDSTWSKHLQLHHESIKQNINSKLWNGQFFADWFDYKRQDYFYPFGNCLAVVWNLTTNTQTKHILSQCRQITRHFTLATNFPKYPWWRIDPLQRLAGVADYQNDGILWWQPIIAYLAALKSQKKDREATFISTQIFQKILSDQKIHECYEASGQPMKRFLYQAEEPFAWAAGMLLWAINYNKRAI